MEKKENIYVSLDEARMEIAKRWQDEDLKKRIENELGDKFMKDLFFEPRGVIWKALMTPDNGMAFFSQCSNYVGMRPLALEHLEGMFVTVNEEKKELGRLHLYENKKKKTVTLIDFFENERKKIKEVSMKNGTSLVEFYHGLLERFNPDLEIFDGSSWVNRIGMASNYYYYFLLHFVAHGALFEVFQLEEDADEKETFFTKEIILPAIKKISDTFGSAPLVLRVYPENQTVNEDFYWWSYPPYINNYLIEYAKKNNLPFKEI